MTTRQSAREETLILQLENVITDMTRVRLALKVAARDGDPMDNHHVAHAFVRFAKATEAIADDLDKVTN